MTADAAYHSSRHCQRFSSVSLFFCFLALITNYRFAMRSIWTWQWTNRNKKTRIFKIPGNVFGPNLLLLHLIWLINSPQNDEWQCKRTETSEDKSSSYTLQWKMAETCRLWEVCDEMLSDTSMQTNTRSLNMLLFCNVNNHSVPDHNSSF